MSDISIARSSMIDCQFRPNEVNDPSVIGAFEAVAREDFVPKSKRSVAYVDEDLPLGGGRYVMEPLVFARLLVAAGIDKGDAVLDIGTGMGYSAAVLAQLAQSVLALESDAELVKKAEERLAAADIHNVAVIEGALAEGLAKQGPYQVIVLQGMVDAVPDALLDQLDEGGRLVCVRMHGGVGRGHVVTKRGGVVAGRDLFDAHITRLPGFEAEKGFVF